MTAIILAGGKSRRMGGAKWSLKLNNKTLLQIIIERLRPQFSKIIVSTGSGKVTARPSKLAKVKIVHDELPIETPLGGIYTCLKRSSNFYSFVVAGDMPFLDLRLIKYLAGNLGNHDVIIPESAKELEPLHAFYSKNCIAPIERSIGEGNFKVTSFFFRSTPQDHQDKKAPLGR